MKLDLSFYKGKTVLVTGHTGFKGSWLCRILVMAGAKVVGYSLEPPTEPNLFTILGLDKQITSIIGDIRDYEKLLGVFTKYKPEIVFHLAAQPIVRTSYEEPRYTFETNVMGTVNVLECARQTASVKSLVNITTDKVYKNDELSNHPFKEDEPLDGFDPYSNSKSCSELVTHSYKKSFFDTKKVAVSTCRAGNVIGGGDFAKDRIVPDSVKALSKGEKIIVRNPLSTRPYQFVLEPLYAYLLVAEAQYNDFSYAGYYNVGPDECDCLNTGDLVSMLCKDWGDGASWESGNKTGPHEASFLKLDCSRLKTTFGWSPKTHVTDAIKLSTDWYKSFFHKENVKLVLDNQIKDFFGGE